MTVGGLVDTVFRFNRLCECHLYTAPRNKIVKVDSDEDQQCDLYGDLGAYRVSYQAGA